MFATLQAKLYGWLAVAGALVLAIGAAVLKGRSWGKQEAQAQITHQQEKAREAIDKVDSKPIDFGAAVDKLRNRSTQK
jgi:hypothetical protein